MFWEVNADACLCFGPQEIWRVFSKALDPDWGQRGSGEEKGKGGEDGEEGEVKDAGSSSQFKF